MRKGILLAVYALTVLAACKKTDNASKFVGTFNGAANAAVPRLVIAEVDKNTISIQLESLYGSTFSPFLSIQSAKVQNATAASADEVGNISGYSSQYHFTGTATLKGDSLFFIARAANTADSTDIKNYSFTGSR